MRRFVLSVALIAVAFGAMSQRTAARQTPPARPPLAADDYIRAETESVVRAWGDAGWFSGAVLVAHGDKVLYRGAAGLASAEFGVRNTPETAFRLVSITQMFTAALVLKLQDEGKLNVHDAVGKYMTSWPEAFKAITIEQLLTGTSGVTDVTQIPEFVKTVAVPRSPKDLVDTILAQPVVATTTPARAPNSNYHLLAALIAQVTGLTYPEAIQKNIAEPLGLTRTAHESSTRVIGQRAEGLNRAGDTFTHAGVFDLDNALGMADLDGTVDDVFRFTRALVGGRLISASALRAMTANHAPPQASANAVTAALAPPIGYGVTLLNLPSGLQWASGGVINGAISSLVYLPDTDVTVVILSNVGGAPEAGAISRTIVNSILAGKPAYHPVRRSPIKPRPEDLAAIAGTWEVAGSLVVTPTSRGPLRLVIRVDGEHIFLKTTGAESEWQSDGPAQFYAPFSDARIVLPADPSGKPQYIIFGNASALTRVPATTRAER